LGFTSHRHSIGHLATCQLYWWRMTSGALLCIIQARTGTWVEQAFSHERIQSPCRDSNPQRWGASGLKSTPLTTRPRTPPNNDNATSKGDINKMWVEENQILILLNSSIENSPFYHYCIEITKILSICIIRIWFIFAVFAWIRFYKHY
jgi:hypothetical protein